jgi:hypothetical protein
MNSTTPSAPPERMPETPAERESGGRQTPGPGSAAARLGAGLGARLASFADRLASWGTWRWFGLAFAVIVIGMLVMGRQWYFGTPVYEIGDNAANSLQIYRATQLLEHLGNYSRFGFHHPGPAFFYVYAVGEVVFYNLLHLTPAPENAHLLAGALLQSAFVAAAIAVVSQYAAPRRGLFVTAALAVALVHFQLAGNPEFSIWPPDQLVVPFACFVVVATAVACGRLGLLPLLVLCGGFLVHGHVAQPLYVVPLAAVAVGLGARHDLRDRATTLRGLVRANLKPALIAAAILAVFVAPLLGDAVQANSNFHQILTSLTQPRAAADAHPPVQIFEYVAAFFGYPVDVYRFDSHVQLASFLRGHWAGFAVSLAALVVLPGALLATYRRRDGSTTAGGASRFYVTSAGIVALAVVLTFVWVAIQKGGLYQFNTYFEYGLMFAAALPILVALYRLWPVRRLRIASGLAGILAIGLVVATSVPMPTGDTLEGLELHDSVTSVLAARTGDAPVLLEFATDYDWNRGAGVALALLRNHVAWYVEPKWGLQFGADHVYNPGSSAVAPEVWTLTAPDATHAGQIVLDPLVSIYPAPPSLSSYRPAP